MAKDEAGQVKDQAASSLKDIVGQSRTELASQAGTSQNRLAEYVHSLSDELGTMASGGSDGTGPLADLAHRGARTGGELSQVALRPRAGRRAERGHPLRSPSPVVLPRRLAARRCGRGSRDPQPGRRGQGRARRAAGDRAPRPRRALPPARTTPRRSARRPRPSGTRPRATSHPAPATSDAGRRLRADPRRLRTRPTAPPATWPATCRRAPRRRPGPVGPGEHWLHRSPIPRAATRPPRRGATRRSRSASAWATSRVT